MTWLKNAWYQAGWSNELEPGGKLSRTILEEPILFWRSANGAVTALLDRCPHRFAPLSAGRIADDLVTCSYHGLGFGRDGACVVNPHAPITSRMNVQSYPLEERHGALWIWMGAPDRADPVKIPDLTFIDETPASARIQLYMPTKAHYQLLADNILDLSHADYLHPNSLGGIMTGAKTTCQEIGDEIVVEWSSTDSVPPAAYRPMVPAGANADIWTRVAWSAPALMVLATAATVTGMPRTRDSEAWTLHNMVPETATTTHYFACSTRRFLVDDESVSAMLRTALQHAFVNEDKWMLELQQQAIGAADFWSLQPILLPIDAGSVRARRKLEAMIAAERTTVPG